MSYVGNKESIYTLWIKKLNLLVATMMELMLHEMCWLRHDHALPWLSSLLFCVIYTFSNPHNSCFYLLCKGVTTTLCYFMVCAIFSVYVYKTLKFTQSRSIWSFLCGFGLVFLAGLVSASIHEEVHYFISMYLQNTAC